MSQHIPAGDHLVLIVRVLAVPYQAPSDRILVRYLLGGAPAQIGVSGSLKPDGAGPYRADRTWRCPVAAPAGAFRGRCPVAATTRYTYQNGEDRYVVSFTRTHDLTASRMADTLKGVKRIAAKLAHFDGAYLRFAGDLEIARYCGGELAETHQGDAIWELMYFGHARGQ